MLVTFKQYNACRSLTATGWESECHQGDNVVLVKRKCVGDRSTVLRRCTVGPEGEQTELHPGYSPCGPTKVNEEIDNA